MNFAIDQWNHGLQENDIKMHSKHNEGISVAAEILIRALKNKIYTYMYWVWKLCVLIK